MTRLADTLAAELAQRAWLGIDAPAAVPTIAGIRAALKNGLPFDITLEDVAEWARPAMQVIASAPSTFDLEGRFVGAIASALILGAKLQETNGT